MKYIFLILSGVTCCLAHPSCSNDELVKCVGKADISAMENEEDLNESCRYNATFMNHVTNEQIMKQIMEVFLFL